MRLEHKIPQLIPMNGRRVKIYHKGIDKLCTKCFGSHRKSECKESIKIDWIDYVKNFMSMTISQKSYTADGMTWLGTQAKAEGVKDGPNTNQMPRMNKD